MKAKAEEARANVIQAEAEVPKAMAEAFRSGNLGIMDYYRMKIYRQIPPCAKILQNPKQVSAMNR